jgi:glutaredoxin
MRYAAPLMFALSILGLGCDAVTELWSGAEQVTEGFRAERPEGWESLDGEDSALRLYYQFVDASRRVRFVERLEDVPESLRANVGFVKLDVPPPLTPGDAARARRARLAGSAAPAQAAPGSSHIVLYSAQWCGACRKAKRYLDRRGVDYEERDIDRQHNAEELQRKTGARAIPVIDVDGRVLTGFSPVAYDALIDRA